MVKDRLHEFQAKANVKNKPNTSRKESAIFDTETVNEQTGFLSISDQWDQIESFLELVNHAKGKLDEMETCLRQIADVHRRLLSEPGVDSSLNKERNTTYDRFNRLCREVKDATTKLSSELDRAGKHRDVNLRIKENQTMAIIRRLQSLFASFTNEQNKYREKSQERICAYMRIAGVNMTPEQVDEAFNKGDFFNTVAVLTADREKKALFEDVRNRHEEILRLEASIRELHELFQDIFMLVDTQGEMMNRIEHNVDMAADHAQKALYSVNYAKMAKKRNLKLKICLAICTVITLIILFAVGTGLFCFYFAFVCR